MAVDHFCNKEKFLFVPVRDPMMEDAWSFEDILDPRRFGTVSDINAVISNTDIDLPEIITEVHLVNLFVKNVDVLSLLERIPHFKLSKLKKTSVDIINRCIRYHLTVERPSRVLNIIPSLNYPCDAVENCIIDGIASPEQYKNFFVPYFTALNTRDEVRIIVLARRCAMWMHMAMHHDNRCALVGLWSAWLQVSDLEQLKGLIVTHTEVQRDFLENYLQLCLLSSLAKTIHRTAIVDHPLVTPTSSNCNAVIKFKLDDRYRTFTCLTHDASVDNIEFLKSLSNIKDAKEASEKSRNLFLYLTCRNDDLITTFGSRNIYIEVFPFEIEHLDTSNKYCVTLPI
jgi:hypothetical protein